MRAERPLSRLPAGIGPSGPWFPALLLAGLTASMFGLARSQALGPEQPEQPPKAA